MKTEIFLIRFHPFIGYRGKTQQIPPRQASKVQRIDRESQSRPGNGEYL